MDEARLARVTDWGARLVADGKLASVETLIWRHERIAHHAWHGLADLARGTPADPNTLYRIYSMTKPITSMAAMMLFEEGRFQLDDPIKRFLPEFADMRVFVAGGRLRPATEPASRDINFRDLLTHTSGLTYGFLESTPIDAMYRANGVDFQNADATLSEVVSRAACLPLLSQPGGPWNYSIATDVLGHLVAVIADQEFGDFVQERILAPLGMDDTGFSVQPEKLPRFAANYTIGRTGALALVDDPPTSRFAMPDKICSGGGGLVGTATDYLQFCRMILGRGQVDGVRLLSRKTVELMAADHVGPERVADGLQRLGGVAQEGLGFGLGFSVMLNPAAAQTPGSKGELAWSGAASTCFWVDPSEDMAVILMTQMMPSDTYNLIRELRVLAYQAIIDG